jgi:hypothetical protein
MASLVHLAGELISQKGILTGAARQEMPRETQKPGGMLRPVCFTQRYQGVIVSSAANKKEECVIDNTCITRLAQGRQSSCHGTPFSLRERLYDRN